MERRRNGQMEKELVLKMDSMSKKPREERHVNRIQTVGPPTLLWQDNVFQDSNMAG